MTLQTRTPTGRPSWPMLLLAGVEKSGKSYLAAQATKSSLVGQAFWVSFGEDDPDEYGQIGDFLIAQHDGTYRDLLRVIDDINHVPAADGLPSLLVLDSASAVWALLKDETQEAAWRRAKAKADRSRQRFDKLADEVKPPMDLWNLAAQRWKHIMDALREHQGPVIITSRLDEVSVIGRDDKPTGQKEWTVQAHKTLPFDVGVIVEMRGYRQHLVRGVRSLRWQAAPDELVPVPDFTVEALWERMGLADATARTHTGGDAATSLDADQTPAPDDLLHVKQRIAALAPDGAPVGPWALKQFADRDLNPNLLEDAERVLAALEGAPDGSA